MKIRTLPCGCKRQIEEININGEIHEIQVFGHTPEKPPLTEKEKQKLALIIQEHLEKKSKKDLIHAQNTI
ncbi:hypothetical protein NOL14_06345 [Streptococcus suis]|uniref:hypothetical protein n=1 Tax=Streptococcus suis TaxID=1307 RepID=UPI001961B43E|nr:hypothetical protein [Streptococcus suis]MBM7153859.1 hypothetical protein [Streptococcus suis]MDG4503657.1 hypothetical protein [Streptococcus suis]HEM4324102.1 hypothetical protein [Streptococcus suis]